VGSRPKKLVGFLPDRISIPMFNNLNSSKCQFDGSAMEHQFRLHQWQVLESEALSTSKTSPLHQGSVLDSTTACGNGPGCPGCLSAIFQWERKFFMEKINRKSQQEMPGEGL
jgi:hypothetical protein